MKCYDLQTCDSAAGPRAENAQLPPDDRDGVAQPRCAAESELVAFYDPLP